MIPHACALYLGGVLLSSLNCSMAEVAVDRTQLPIKGPEVLLPSSTTFNVRDATPPSPATRFEVKAPASAPNVLIILIDDMGFGQPSVFGGPIKMATAERLAENGLRYNRFHTTALSAPTRAALLTGRNSHSGNMGFLPELATAFPGQTGSRPESMAPLAKILRYNGHSTAQFGKNHETPIWEVTPSGPTDRWPTRNGFDKFYGFFGGHTNHLAPTLYQDMTRIETPKDPKYHLMTDMTDQAITWVRTQKLFTPEKPFFIYFAPGATHAPHHVPASWSDRYKGKFDQGWDQLRAETLAKQIALGVVPPNTRLAPKPSAIKDWDKLSAGEKRLFARQMEIFASFAEFTDHEIGRLIDTLSELKQLDNTLIFYILGDNGASAEGGLVGLFNEMTYYNGVTESVEEMLKREADLGGPYSNPHYAAGWAVAGNTPFTWTKQIASNYGGTRSGMVVHWPKQLQSNGKGAIRSQWHHVIDIVPTILDAIPLPQPKVVDGVIQAPIEGVSMLASLHEANAPELHLTQYFELLGNRGIYHEGWFAGATHKAPWDLIAKGRMEDDVWELYDTRQDFSLANNLASKHPEKVQEMQALFLQEAKKYQVLPLDDRTVERSFPALVGRPDLMANRSSITLYEGMTAIPENMLLNLKNRSHTITANLQITSEGVEGVAGANGVVVAQAGRFGGWSLYLKKGIPTYTYNWMGFKSYTIAAASTLPAGKANLRFEFHYDREGDPSRDRGVGRGGVGMLFVNNNKVAEGRIAQTHPYVFAVTEGTDVGQDAATPVTEEYGTLPPHKFTGKIESVILSI
ncbi:MAG: arylsulfatase [Oligoflexia bacterium]|nr:arylsulfatase [Oligoflexia bacterium]